MKALISSLVLSLFLLAPALSYSQPKPCELVAQLKLQISAVESNIANVNTTQTPNGGAYHAKRIRCSADGCQVMESRRIKIVYEPDHPDANPDGYVTYPDINLMAEMREMIRLSRESQRASAQCSRIVR